MQKYSERADPYPAMDGFIARTVNKPGPDDHARDSTLLTIFGDYFLLFEFCEAISFPPELGPCFDRTRFIQHVPPRLLRVRINRKRTDINKPPQAFLLHACFH